ncbi:MAG: hybrid sensor histidine kinase/response regulator [Campylobacteraceae bacterium]|nr:hybrid sensor histidine kinase/response regulator [Campylobacteraceae bacterium]
MKQLFTILLVDDIEQNLDALSLMILDEFDVKIEVSKSAQDAIDKLMKKDINLILTDIQMPDIDGFEFAEYLKGIDKIRDIPVIFITGIYDKDEYQQKGYDLGAIEYITKPINNALFTSKLRVYIKLFEDKIMRENELNQKNEIIIYQSKMAAMGEMINVISHQLKQPLNILSLYCQDIKSSFDFNEINEEFVKDFDESTKFQIQFLSKTIDDFRDYFNPNKLKKDFSIEVSVNKILNLMKKQLEENEIKILMDIQEKYIYGTESEFEQVLINLISNAKEALVENKIIKKEIQIKSFKNDDCIEFFIEDNAGGVPHSLKNKIFNPYFTTKDKGTGVGLYMARLVIEASFGSHLNVENGDKGARFIMNFQKN